MSINLYQKKNPGDSRYQITNFVIILSKSKNNVLIICFEVLLCLDEFQRISKMLKTHLSLLYYIVTEKKTNSFDLLLDSNWINLGLKNFCNHGFWPNLQGCVSLAQNMKPLTRSFQKLRFLVRQKNCRVSVTVCHTRKPLNGWSYVENCHKNFLQGFLWALKFIRVIFMALKREVRYISSWKVFSYIFKSQNFIQFIYSFHLQATFKRT